MRPSSRIHRGAAHVATTLVALVAMACYSTRTVGRHELQGRERLDEVKVHLVDGTLVTLGRPVLFGDIVRGEVIDCRGRSCAAVVERGGVPLGAAHSLTVTSPDAGRSIMVVLGLAALGTIVVVALISGFSAPAATVPLGSGGSISCPTVYSFDGKEWILDSGTYGGSFFAAAQRTDSDLLERLVAVNGEYRLRMVNAANESDHTDAVALDVVDHPPGTQVVPAMSGQLVTFTDPQPPQAAHDLRGRDVLTSVLRKDGVVFRSDPSNRWPDRAEDTRDGVVLQLTKPAGARTAKVWLSGMNTPWSVAMVEYVLAQRGPTLPAWVQRMNEDREARRRFVELMVDEGMLTVSVQTERGWSRRGFFWEAGPEVRKDQALVIPIADVPGDRLTLKLDSPVGFWTIDAVAVDYGPDVPVEVTRVAARRAVEHDGRDLAATLATVDGVRYSTERGASAELVFDAPPPRAQRSRSVVLVTTGYYLPHVTVSERADPAALDALLATPGAASRQSLAMLNVTLLRLLLR